MDVCEYAGVCEVTQNNERSDYVLCHPRNPTREDYLGSRTRLEIFQTGISRPTVAVHLFDFLFRFTHKNSEKLFHSGTHQNFNLHRNDKCKVVKMQNKNRSPEILGAGLGLD